MKTPSRNVTRLVIWTTLGSLTFSSCSETIVKLANCTTQTMEDYGSSAIRISFNDDVREDITRFQSIINRIISDAIFAQEFAQNPKKYLLPKSEITRVGDSEDVIVVDELLVKIAESMADQRVLDAIHDKNFSSYIDLMYEKGLLDPMLVNNSELTSLFTQEQVDEILNSLGYDRQSETGAISPVLALSAFLAVVAAAALWVAIICWNRIDIADHNNPNISTLLDSDAFTIWLINSVQEVDFQDQEIENYINEIVSSINQHNINCTSVSAKKVEATIVLNNNKISNNINL